MDFAKKQLQKYGWTEGKGLGRNEDGISTPLKAKLKFDNSGMGHDAGEQFTNKWWERVYNSAAENIDMNVDDNNEVKLQIKDKDAVEISTKTYSIKNLKKNTSLEYGSFIKTAKLTEKGTEHYATQPLLIKPQIHHVLTDEELFAACGGRTAHKGARHGLTLGGKLSRIEKQERLLLKQMKKVSLNESSSKVEKKLKKLKKQKPEKIEKYTPIVTDMSPASTSSSSIKSSIKKKKKNKKPRNVSFNDNVIVKVCSTDLDTSIDSEGSVSIKDENDGSDEGIDLENNNVNVEDNQKAFEEARLNFSDLSKAERKKLKKKRDFDAKANNVTAVEFEEALSKKRKYLEEEKYKKKSKKKKSADERAISSISMSLEGSCRISESD